MLIRSHVNSTADKLGASTPMYNVISTKRALHIWLSTLVAATCLLVPQFSGPADASDRNESFNLIKQGGARAAVDFAERAATALAEKRFQEAVVLYTQALLADSTMVEYFLSRGRALEMCNQAEKALQDYNKALQVDPTNTSAMIASARIIEMNPGGEAEALALYRKALLLTLDAAFRDKIKFSIAVLESRMAAESESSVGCWNIGNRSLKREKLDEAEAFFSQAIELNPKLYQAYYSRALTRLKKEDNRGALEDLSAAINLCPSLRGCLIARALLYESSGMLPEAVADLKQAASLDVRDPQAHYHLGRLQEKIAAYEDALSSYLEAMRWRPKPDLRDAIKQRINILGHSVKPTLKQAPYSDRVKPLW